jgi:hypothetical protein
MKLVTPFDYWRAGFEMWLTGWKMQMVLQEQLLSGLNAYRAGFEAPPSTCTPAPGGRMPAARGRVAAGS